MSDSWTADPDSMLEETVGRVMVPIGEAFAQLWRQENAAELLDGFLAGRVTFHLKRDGIEVLEVVES